jgi:cell shape-determining protein MreD
VNRGWVIGYLGLLVAGATGFLHAAVSPVVLVAGVKPNLLLVGVVLASAVAGLTAGSAWAFVGGLAANLVLSEPLGSIPLTLLLVAALVAGLRPVLGHFGWLYPLVAAAAASLLADLVALAVFSLVSGAAEIAPRVVLIAAVLNLALVACALVPLRLWTLRRRAEGRWAW